MKGYMKIVLGLVALLWGSIHAQTPEDLFSRANAHYHEEHYEEAAELYMDILEKGYESKGVYYNLGNCYFKLNQLGPAIINYRRAEHLAPYDEEVQHNLKLARKATIDDFELMPMPLFRSAYLRIVLLIGSDTWAWLSLTALFLLIIGSALYYYTSLQRPGFILGFGALLCFLTFLALALANKSYQSRNTPAIVMAASSYAKSGPGEKAEDVFILHEGAEVQIIEEYEAWSKLRLPDGKLGWVLGDDLEPIFSSK